METLPPSDMSSRPAGCDSPEPLSSASPKNQMEVIKPNVYYIKNHYFYAIVICISYICEANLNMEITESKLILIQTFKPSLNARFKH